MELVIPYITSNFVAIRNIRVQIKRPFECLSFELVTSKYVIFVDRTQPATQKLSGYIVMLRARMFRSLIIRTGIKERNIRARKARFPLGEFVRTNRRKSRNASYLFAAIFFASQF